MKIKLAIWSWEWTNIVRIMVKTKAESFGIIFFQRRIKILSVQENISKFGYITLFNDCLYIEPEITFHFALHLQGIIWVKDLQRQLHVESKFLKRHLVSFYIHFPEQRSMILQLYTIIRTAKLAIQIFFKVGTTVLRP